MTRLTSISPLAATQRPGDKPQGSSWLEAQAEAWGQTLDRQASRIEDLSAQISGGNDQPGVVTELSAAAQVMTFLSSAAHTSVSSSGEALKTLSQKS